MEFDLLNKNNLKGISSKVAMILLTHMEFRLFTQAGVFTQSRPPQKKKQWG
jgi:hypothetical protein